MVSVSSVFQWRLVYPLLQWHTVSGCPVNPAVSIAMFINKRITGAKLGLYLLGQIIGALLGSLILYVFLQISNLPLMNLGQNSFGALGTGGSLLAEFILTFVFVLVIIVVMGKNGNDNLACLVIGLTLVLIHLFGIPPRSLGPAIFAGGEALSQLWVFIVAPIAGGILAAIIGKSLFDTENGNESIANKNL